jgi:hypothetical protein|tara:strand:- start:356 stop:640 length:285 start_codon:yes stop_codon:yes gene_type:complete
MHVTPNKRVNTVIPYGITWTTNTTKKFGQRFRTFSVYNHLGTCTVTLYNGNTMTIPVGITVNFDAAEGSGREVNTFITDSFSVTADNCVIIGTI